MKTTNQLLTGIVNQQGSASTTVTVPVYDRVDQPQNDAEEDLGVRLINDLFIFLKNSYPSFRNQYKNDEQVNSAKREWKSTLIENGVTSQEQIYIGKISVRKKGGEWAPGPSDFCKMCVPQDLGIPEVTQAYYEAANAASHVESHPWSHGIVYAAGKQVGWFSLRTQTAKVTQPQFNKVYKDMLQRMHMGEAFTAPEQIKTTVNRITVDSREVRRTKTQRNKNAAAKAREGFKW